MSYLLALDQGTTSSRALIFSDDGRVHALAQREFRQIYPRAGWVEHDPHEILDTQFAVVCEVLDTAGLRARDIAALGITNQRETCLLWERRGGRACGNALVWQDRRTAERCNEIRASGLEPWLQEKTGLLVDPYFSGSKLGWMLDTDPLLRRRAQAGELAFGTIDSWLIWHLTDGRAHLTDATNASRTQLFDIHRGDWDDELLNVWRIPREVLPTVIDSVGSAASTTRFGDEITIAGVAGDQQAALFGQACFAPGMAKCTYGTGCFALLHTGREAARSEHRLLTTIALRSNGVIEYALEGSVFMGGATVQWLRDGLGIISSAGEVESLAATVTDSDGVVLVPAFTGLGAPYWDAEARALLIGMTRGTQRAHIARAALDGIAWQVADIMRAMAGDAGVALKELRVDGGACANDLLMQIQADYLDLRLVRPRMIESTAFGAALLAGLGSGVFADRAAVTQAWQAERSFAPQLDAARTATLARRWRRAVERAQHWHEHG